MPSKQALRDNAFIVAAIALPLLVAAFFLIASTVPRWTVPLPSYDALLKVDGPYDGSKHGTTVDFGIRDERVVAFVKPADPNGYAWPRRTLLLVDHATLTAKEVPFTAPDRLDDGEKERVVVVEALATTPISTAVEAPDGYALRMRNGSGGPGLIGGVFGMGSYRQRVSLFSRGRAVNIALPAPFTEAYRQVTFVGWVTGDARR